MTNTKFLNSGKHFKEVRESQARLLNSSQVEKLPIGIKMPLEFGFASQDSLFKMNTDIFVQVSNNYRHFLSTKKGEVLCNPDYGLTLHNLFNRSDLEEEQKEEIAMDQIKENTEKYFPFIQLLSFESSFFESEKNITQSIDPNVPNTVVTVPAFYSIKVGYTIGNREKQNYIIINIRKST